MSINKERKRFLDKERKEYEKATPMTPEERSVLHEWVREGNSVHENGAFVYHEDGRLLDFLDVYREEEKIRGNLAIMTCEEGSRYLLEEYGIDRDAAPRPAPTYDELRKEAGRLSHECILYCEFLSTRGMWEEACEYVRTHWNEELPFEEFEWDTAQ